MTKLFNLGLFDEQLDKLYVEENTVCDVLLSPLGDIDEVYFNDTPSADWQELEQDCGFIRTKMTLTDIFKKGINTDTAFYGVLADNRYLVFTPNFNSVKTIYNMEG